MKIRIGFNGSFNGLLYSAGKLIRVICIPSLTTMTDLQGYAYDPDCMYINGSSGRDYYEFFIQLNRCGTLGKNSLHEDSRKNPTVSLIQLSLISILWRFISLRKTSCGTQWQFSTIPWSKKNSTNISKLLVNMDMIFGKLLRFLSWTLSKHPLS